MSKNNVQEKILAYLLERGWDKLPVEDLAKSISIESAELLEHFQWTNTARGQTSKITNDSIKANPIQKEEIESELADVLIYAIQGCIQLGSNYEEVILRKLEKAKIKYPPSVGLNNEEYLRIKQEYRAGKKK